MAAKELKNEEPAPGPGSMQFYTSGNADLFKNLLPSLLGESGPVQQVAFEIMEPVII
jgi:hypothetical protein